jgi:hypothetical protein
MNPPVDIPNSLPASEPPKPDHAKRMIRGSTLLLLGRLVSKLCRA